MTRIWLLAALVAGIWALTFYGQFRPDALGFGATPMQFSAARADAVLMRLAGPQQPHPVGSVEAAGLRARLLAELAALNIRVRTRTAMSCLPQKIRDVLVCGTVTNILAGDAAGKVLLMAHTDSVPAGPGAADDLSGAATIVETLRALQARGRGDVSALFTDGEEAGLLGVAAYLRDPQSRAHPVAVINVEARGNQGPSYLFQTSAGNAKLIDLYADSVSHYATSSLYSEVYKALPNDTDLTVFLGAGFSGYNFAFIGNSAQYHTALDRRENLDARSLQQQGDNVLGLADTLSRADTPELKSGDAIYLDVLGRWLPRLPQRLALPLSLCAFALIALAGFFTRRERRMLRRPIRAMLMPPLLVALCAGAGFALSGLAAWIFGHANPAFAYPHWLRLSLGFGVWAMALIVARGAGAIACWLWFAILAIACSLFLPGLTPYFLFPALVAAPLLLVTVRKGRGLALLIAALAALVVWIGLTASGEAILGVDFHLLFTLSAAFGLIALLPLLAKSKGRAWGWSLALSLTAAIALAVTAGWQPAFSPAAPMRLNMVYGEQAGRAFWITEGAAVPDRWRALAHFSAAPLRGVADGYVAAAGPAQLAPPTAHVSRHGAVVTVDIDAPGDGVVLRLPSGVQSAQIGGVTTGLTGAKTELFCATSDCGHAQVTLHMASPRGFDMLLIARRYGLPPQGLKFLQVRPRGAVASQQGDRTLVAATIAVPAQ